MSLADLGRGPTEVLASLAPIAGSESASGFAKNLRWLLEQFRDQSVIRIHCGGEEIAGKRGEVWGSDRFFLGGLDTRKAWLQGVLDTFPGEIHGAEESALYKTHRRFPKEQASTSGYRIPLPKGTYRVTLHFAELYWAAPGLRRFDVIVEGQEVLKEHDIFASVGFATAEVHEFGAEVSDGMLEIVLVPRVDCPMVSAIEVERVR